MKNAKAKEKNPMSFSGEMQHQDAAEIARKISIGNAKRCQERVAGKSLVQVEGYRVKTWKYV